MINKIKYCLNLIWTSLLAYSFPICFELIYLDITAHSKGYGYDLGSEKDISIMSGCVELLIWLILAVPSNIYVFRKTLNKGKLYLLIHIVVYLALAVSCILISYGGWVSYIKEVFNL